ncbi:MAG: hypothetical protein ABI634_00080 [Acidobacteriota bacterium]
MKAATLMFMLGTGVPLLAQAPGTSQTAVVPAPGLATIPAAIHIGSRVGDLPTGYDEGSRRDPFASLIVARRAASQSGADGSRARTGLSNVALADVNVRGVIRSGTTIFAILEAANKQSFTVRPKDRLLDAVVISIDKDGVTFADQTTGMTPSQVKKTLRAAGEDIR